MNKLIFGAGGGFDIFGAFPKILQIIKNKSKPFPNIVIISNSDLNNEKPATKKRGRKPNSLKLM